MQATQSDLGPIRRHMLQWKHHYEHLVVRHSLLDYNRLCLCHYAFCYPVESSDEEEAEVHGCRYAEPWLFVSGPS